MPSNLASVGLRRPRELESAFFTANEPRVQYATRPWAVPAFNPRLSYSFSREPAPGGWQLLRLLLPDALSSPSAARREGLWQRFTGGGASTEDGAEACDVTVLYEKIARIARDSGVLEATLSAGESALRSLERGERRDLFLCIARCGSNPALTPLPVANPVFEPSCGQWTVCALRPRSSARSASAF